MQCQRNSWSWVWLLCVIAPATFSSTYTLAEERPWRLQDPIVIHSEDPPADARNFLWMGPAGFCRVGEATVLGSMKGIKRSPSLDLWMEQDDRSWRRFASLAGINWPKVFSVGNNVGTLGSVGKDIRGGYGNTIKFYSASKDGKVREPVDVVVPESNVDRLAISSVHANGDAISAFLLLEKRREKNRLLYVRSVDGGKKWSEPQNMGETTMHEDNSRLGSFQWSAEHLGRFVVERDGRILFYRSRDAGRSWKSEQIVLTDDLGDGAKRMPLGSVQFKGGQGIVYIGFRGNTLDSGTGKYYFSKSTDQAKTWSKGLAITDKLKMDDVSSFVQLAASGERVAFSYIEVKGAWSKGEIECRLMVSEDGGAKWTAVPLEQFYRGVAVFSALAADESVNRILFSTSICMDPKQKKRNYLTVQEFSTRILPGSQTPTEKDRQEIKALIKQLADESFEARDQATQRLAAMGRAAKEALSRAAKASEDLEVKNRAQHLISRLFPECLRFDVEQ